MGGGGGVECVIFSLVAFVFVNLAHSLFNLYLYRFTSHICVVNKDLNHIVVTQFTVVIYGVVEMVMDVMRKMVMEGVLKIVMKGVRKVELIAEIL